MSSLICFPEVQNHDNRIGFNKTEAAFFPMQTVLPEDFPFSIVINIQLIVR